MKTDWRKLRDDLTSEEAFSTFDTFNHKDRGYEIPGENPTVNSAKSAESLQPDVINSWEWIAERAAILQFDAGLDREQAEVQAFMCWYHHFVEAD